MLCAESIEWIFNRPFKQHHPEAFARALSGLEIDPRRCVLIAGTNGKGTVLAMLEQLLIHSGFQVLSTISPHLVDVRERIRLDGLPISPAEWTELVLDVREKAETFKLSFFETVVLMATHKWSQIKADWFLVEVGIGGRFDATNQIPHDWNVITTIGHDHEELLGGSLEAIAAQKVGILSRASTLVTGQLPSCVLPVIREEVERSGSTWFQTKLFPCRARGLAGIEIKTPWGTASCTMLGSRACENAATAIQAFLALTKNALKVPLVAFKKVNWPGRFQEIIIPHSPCPVFLSGDHNPEGISSLIELIYEHVPAETSVHFIFGCSKQKRAEQLIEKLKSLSRGQLLLSESPYQGQDLSTVAKDKSLLFFKNPDDALERAFTQARSNDLIVVTGSLYLTGYFLERYHQKT